jgi:hypothetical protein
LVVSLVLVVAGLFLTRLPRGILFINGHELFFITYDVGGVLFLAGMLLAAITLLAGNILEL